MCVVEVKNSIKPVISCATLIYKDMDINTNSILVCKARESVLQFVLNNHPLDCPICDQGGECDSQDQYIVMGSVESRYYEINKKFVKDKNISFILKLSLNKCINCTRCTRFSQVICGNYNYSLLGRGEHIFISNYLKELNSLNEMISNVMDLCPVGAITSKIMSYNFRVWELNASIYVDFFDIFHPCIRIDYKGLKLARIIPLMDDFIKEEWISDKIRVISKTFSANRILYNSQTLLRKRYRLSWKVLFSNIKNYLINNLNYLCNRKFFLNFSINLCRFNTDVYNFIFYKSLFKRLFYFDKGINLKNTNRKLNMLDRKDINFFNNDTFIIYNFNIRNLFPILSFKLREKSIFDFSKVIVLGFVLNLNYYYEYFSNELVFFIKNYSFLNIGKFFLYYIQSNSIDTCIQVVLNKYANSFLKDLSCLDNLNVISFEFNRRYNFVSNSLSSKFSTSFLFNDFLKDANNIKSRVDIFFASNFCREADFNVILKLVFERSSMFLNLFGVINNFTFCTYRYFSKKLKSEWYIFKSFFRLCNVNVNFFISNFKNYIISPKWKYFGYKLNIYDYFNFIIYCCYVNFLNVQDENILFFNDVISNKSNVIKIVNKVNEYTNKLNYFIKFNKLFWLF